MNPSKTLLGILSLLALVVLFTAPLHAEETLGYYRRKGLLRGTQIGKCVRYRRVELERFLDLITRQNPR